MLTIIEIKDREDGGHGLQSQSHRTECWLEGWLAVPPELEQTAWDCAGYCDLDIQDGKLVGLTPREQPPKPEPEPDLTPQFRTAMLSYAATSTAIPDSYALDMSDLFPTWAAVLAVFILIIHFFIIIFIFLFYTSCIKFIISKWLYF